MNGSSGLDEAEHPKGSKDNPLTRDDVLRLRDEFLARLEALLAAGDKLSEAELTLNFSSKTFQAQIDLENVEFAGVVTREDRLVVWHTNFQGARLVGANLQQANLWRANLQGAHLVEANLQGAHLMESNLQGAYLWGPTSGKPTFGGPTSKDPTSRGGRRPKG